MALFRGIQEYIALDANNITLVFDSGNIVNISGNIFLYPPQGHPILYNYYTRSSMNIHLPKINHSFGTRCMNYSLPVILNNSPTFIFNELFTHSLKGFSVYVKKDFIKNYIFVCTNVNCYVCNQ